MIDVLVPHDLTPLSDAGLEVARDLQVPVQHLHVLHVLPRVDASHPGLVWPRDEDEPRRAHALRKLAERLEGTPFADAILHVKVGDPGSQVVELARELGVGLITIASHGRTGLQRMVLGSVAEHVARFAACPVVIVPPAAAHPLPASTAAPPRPAPTSHEEHVDEIGCEVSRRVEQTEGRLTAIRVAIPEGADADQWERDLEARMAASGIDWVDIAFQRTSGTPALLDARFDDLW